MIKTIRLLNYKKFKEETIKFDRINVFIGANGAGKSSIAASIYSIATIIRLGLKSAFPEGLFSFNNVINFDRLSFGYKFSPIGLGIDGVVDGSEFEYDIVFAKNTKSMSGFYINFERLKIITKDKKIIYKKGIPPKSHNYDYQENEIRENWPDYLLSSPYRDTLFSESTERLPEQVNDVLWKIKRYMQRISKFQFSPAAARTGFEQYKGDGRQPFLKSDGSNLAEVIQFLQEEEKGGFNNLRTKIIKYAQGSSKIVDIGVSAYDEKAYLNFFEEGSNRKTFEVRGHFISDGYWVFASFACLASCGIIPTWVFFEEPESYLHPHKLPLLIEIFDSLTKRQESPCQVMLSTHSPYLLDLFRDYPDSIFLIKDGSIKTLSDIPDYEEILSIQSLGDAWYSNIFGSGNP